VPTIAMAAKGRPPMRSAPLWRGYAALRRLFRRGKAHAWAQPVTYLGVAMLVAIYCILAFLIHSDRQETVTAAQRQGDNLVRIIDKSYSHVFESIDATLRFLRINYQQQPTTFDVTDWITNSFARNELTFDFVILDASGKVIDATPPSTTPPIIGADLSSRDYFQRQLSAATDELFIGVPVTLKFSGTTAIVLSRRITASDGSFAGVVTALISPSALGKAAAGLDLGENGTFGLVGRDGIVRTRVVNGKVDAGQSGRHLLPTSGLMLQAARERSGAFWNTPERTDGISRYVSYRVLDDFPLIAYVAIAETEIFAHANQEAAIYLGIAFILTLAILVAIRSGMSRERKLNAATAEMKQAQAELHRNQERYRLVENAVNDGIWDHNLLTKQVYFSPRWHKILGYSEGEIAGTDEAFLGLLHPDDVAMVRERRQANLEGPPDAAHMIEFRLRHKDGSYRWVNSRGKALRDPEGRPIRMLGTITDITDRKKAQAAIEESHANLARAEEMSHLGHIKFEMSSGLYTWSGGVYRIMGKSPDSFTPTLESSLALIHPDDREVLETYRNNVLSGVVEQPVIVRTVEIRGRVGHLEVWSAPLIDSAGAVVGMFGTVQDVTERKLAEAAITESHANLARAESMILLGHYKFDAATGHSTWSEGAYRVFGKSRDTFVPTRETVTAIFHPDDRAALHSHQSQVLAGKALPRLKSRIVNDNGEIAIVESWSTPTADEQGNTTGYFGTVQDVTERFRADAAINESHTNLERAERMALLGHYRIDRKTGQLTWSNGVYRIFGLSPETFTPNLRGALELIHPDDRQLLKKVRDEAMAGSEIPHVAMRAFRRDGQLIDIEYWATPVRGSDGAITGVFGTLQDITIRKRAEETLARANQELEARVNERTAALADEMRRREQAQMTMSQMQKMEAVGQLTAGIAHDFNNLLAVIGGSLEFVDTAAARGLTAEPELIDAALRATRRGRELVRRLLAFSRQSPLRAEATTIDQMVLDTLRLLQRTLGQSIDMVTQLDAKAAVISVDRNQMANALLNLALNARDAMPDGGQLTIATKCRPVSPDTAAGSSRWPTGEEVCIVISDTGIGMTDEVRSRAFEPFFTTKPDGLGSGLGLSMVQGFVEQSGGRIEIDSAPDNGTIVTICLPRIASESQADDADPVTGTPAGGREKTVLLVEDDPDVRVVTTAQLRQLGYKVHAVATGMEAMDLIASPANIDITLTDIVLPGGLDGVALVKEAMRARPKMGVLCMSGYNPTQKHRKWLQMQNINFLEKPFSSSRLAQALDAALAQ
jgi:PAS domain S-box-containing protein